MNIQQQKPSPIKWWQRLGQQLKHLPWIRLLFFLPAAALIVTGAIIWIQNSNSKGPLPNTISIIFIAAGLVGVLLQWLFPMHPISKTDPSTVAPPLPIHSPQPISQPPSSVPPPTQPTSPEPSTIWTIPYRRNPFFTGRDEILTRLHTMLTSNQPTALTQPQAISGLGGIGKTQTAIEYAYHYRNDYRYIFWIRADSREAIISDFVTLATTINLPEKDTPDQGIIVKAFKRWLETHTDWLLILDNTDDLEVAYDFLPAGDKGHILLTTRAQAMGTLANPVTIEKFTPEEGVLFLLHRTRLLPQNAPLANTAPANRTIALKIVEEMDGLPLALDQAAAYIEETRCSLSNYLSSYQKERAALLKRRGGIKSDHPPPVASTWSLSFQKVEAANPADADLLRLCAFLAPDAIPEEIFTEGTPDLGPNLQSVADDPLKLNEAIGELLKYSLVRRNPDKTLTMHRLVQTVLKDEMDKDMQRQWAERTVRAINRIFPEVEYETWPQCERYLPQARLCAVLIEQWDMAFPEAGRLLNQVGYYLKERAQYVEVGPLLQRALAIREKVLGSEHLDVAASLNDLALLYEIQGKYVQAEPLYQRALVIREQMLEPEHPLVATSLNNLASLYRTQGRYAEAEPLYQRALAIREKELGPEHPHVAISLNNLALLYKNQGRYAEAEPLYQRALAIREKVLGPEHPEVAQTLNNLASLYRTQGRYAEAEPLLQQALAIREKVLGPEHSHVAISLNNLALLYKNQGKYVEAEALYRRVLAIREQVLGEGHPLVAATLENYADLLRETKRDDEAIKLEERAREIREKNAGENRGLRTVVKKSRSRNDESQLD